MPPAERDAPEDAPAGEVDALHARLAEAEPVAPCRGRFQLMRDEDTGRLYWFGFQDGWKGETEIGEDGTLTLKPEHFAVGTVLALTEPASPPPEPERDEARALLEEVDADPHANLTNGLKARIATHLRGGEVRDA